MDERWEYGETTLQKTYHGAWGVTRVNGEKRFGIMWDDHEIVEAGERIELNAIGPNHKATIQVTNGGTYLKLVGEDYHDPDGGNYMAVQIPQKLADKIFELIQRGDMTYG